MRKVVFMVCLVALVAMISIAGTGQNAKKDQVNNVKSDISTVPGTGVFPAAVLGTAWITYDDGSMESDGNTAGFPSGGAVGNVFVPNPAWGTFYCDQFSIYHATVNSGFSMSYYAGINTAGTALTGNTYAHFNAASSGNGVWNLETAATGWVGNATANWNAATGFAYIAAYQSATDNIGLDTSGAHGFGVTNYTGAGFAPGAWNAMLRARFNGASVPVELVGFTVE